MYQTTKCSWTSSIVFLLICGCVSSFYHLSFLHQPLKRAVTQLVHPRYKWTSKFRRMFKHLSLNETWEVGSRSKRFKPGRFCNTLPTYFLPPSSHTKVLMMILPHVYSSPSSLSDVFTSLNKKFRCERCWEKRDACSLKSLCSHSISVVDERKKVIRIQQDLTLFKCQRRIKNCFIS